jgi:hypothetical protein
VLKTNRNEQPKAIRKRVAFFVEVACHCVLTSNLGCSPCLRDSVVGSCFFRSPMSRSLDHPNLAPPPPPWAIPDWRGFERHHPKSSQIGEDFSNLALIGVRLRVSALGNSGDFGNRFCGPLPAFFSQPTTGHRRFVDNKHQTAIRPNGDRTVEPLLLCFPGLQSVSISALFSRSCPSVGRGSQTFALPCT